jgi:cell division protein FtsL
MLWLGLFLVVAGLVVARQTAGYQIASRLRDLRQEHRALEARRAELERSIRELSSRQVLALKALRDLGLHEPTDSELVLFPWGAAASDQDRR